MSDFAGAGTDGCPCQAGSSKFKISSCLGACLPLLVWELKAAFVGPVGSCQARGLVTFTLLSALGDCCPVHWSVPRCHHLFGAGRVEGASVTTCVVGASLHQPSLLGSCPPSRRSRGHLERLGMWLSASESSWLWD